MRWIVSYFSTGLGLLVLMFVALVALGPLFVLAALTVSLAEPAQHDIFALAISAIYGPIWLWFSIRLFLPVIFRLAVAGWRGILGISYLTPTDAIQIVRDGLQTMKRDFRILFGRRMKGSTETND